ncbi:hypothetical protein HY642_03310 [Candidatus Woesearchaeota archaeon]|nr:hypothetical protein [Candidatus Woesearchaeota archaeon]
MSYIHEPSAIVGYYYTLHVLSDGLALLVKGKEHEIPLGVVNEGKDLLCKIAAELSRGSGWVNPRAAEWSPVEGAQLHNALMQSYWHALVKQDPSLDKANLDSRQWKIGCVIDRYITLTEAITQLDAKTLCAEAKKEYSGLQQFYSAMAKYAEVATANEQQIQAELCDD